MRAFARQIAWRLVKEHDVKLLVVACNTAAAAGLDELADELPVPVIDVIEPGVRSLVAATRSGRVGVIGTVGTISSGAYQRAVADVGADVELTCAACPGFVEFVERGETSGDEVMVLAERLLAPVRDAGVDTLLLGCTHYPYLARVIADVMGRDVVLVELGRRDRVRGGGPPRRAPACARDGAGSGVHRWYSSGDVAWFADLGRRLLGPELASAERCAFDEPEQIAMTSRPDGRAADELRPVTFERDFTDMAAGSVLVSFGRTRVVCTASIDEDVPRWMRGTGRGWVTAEYSMLPGSSPERIDREAARRQAERAHDGDPAPHRPLAAGRHATSWRWARSRSPSTATCSRPTAAPARRRSAAATSPCTTRCPGSCRPGLLRTQPLVAHCAAISVGIVDAVPAARPALRRGLQGRGRHERGDDVGGALRRGAGHRRGQGVQPQRAGHAAGAGRGRHQRDLRPAVGVRGRAAAAAAGRRSR